MSGGGPAPRVLFLRRGTFSHSNAQLLTALRRIRPDVAFDDFDVEQALRRDPLASARAMAGALAAHRLRAVRSRRALREAFSRNPGYVAAVASIVRAQHRRHAYVCSIQTQSLFDGAVGPTPNYLYTDHAARARLEPDWRGGDRPDPAWLATETEIYRNARHVFTFGSTIRRLLVEAYGLPADRVSRAGCGASAMPTRPPPRDLDRYARRRVLFVGIDWARKGGPDLLAAFEILRARLPDATLDIVGCSPPEAAGRPGVACYGKIPLAAVEERYREASCFCMPTRREPFGVVFVEAAHFALPAVGTRVGDIEDIVRDGENGWRVPPADPPALAEALFRVLESPETAQRMGAAAASIAPEWTWDAVAAHILARTPLDAAARAA